MCDIKPPLYQQSSTLFHVASTKTITSCLLPLASPHHSGHTDLLKPKSGPVCPYSEYKSVLTMTMCTSLLLQPLTLPAPSLHLSHSTTLEHSPFPLPHVLFPISPPSLPPPDIPQMSSCPKIVGLPPPHSDTFYFPSLIYFVP